MSEKLLKYLRGIEFAFFYIQRSVYSLTLHSQFSIYINMTKNRDQTMKFEIFLLFLYFILSSK
jgi:hypothetical protein